MKSAIHEVPDSRRPNHFRNLSIPGIPRQSGERTSLLRRRSFHEPGDVTPEEEEIPRSASLAGGTVLGIHNLAIVAPQFIVRPDIITLA